MSDQDPRKAKTLGEACSNGDGTFNVYRLMSWLSEATNPGKGIPVEETKKLVDEAVVRAKIRKATGT